MILPKISIFIFALSLCLFGLGCSQPKGTNLLGESCNTPNECVSSLCAEIDGIRQCTQACSMESRCPDGYDCFSGYCIIETTTETNPPSTPQPQSECLSIYDCMSECETDQECLSDCFLNGAPIGQQTLIQLEDCVAIMCLTLDDTCFDQYCEPEYTGCISDQISPIADCFSTYICQSDCEEESCFNACVAESNENTLDDLSLLNMCVDEQSDECSDASCVISTCRTEFQTCFRP